MERRAFRPGGQGRVVPIPGVGILDRDFGSDPSGAVLLYLGTPAPAAGPASGGAHQSGPLAQLAEQQTLNLRVVGSIPTRLTTLPEQVRAKFALGPAGTSFLGRLRLRARIVEPTPLSSPVSRDADEDVVLATAGAAVIVTGDEDLLVIDRGTGIDVVSPRGFLARLSS